MIPLLFLITLLTGAISFLCSLTEAVLLSLNPLSLRLRSTRGERDAARWLRGLQAHKFVGADSFGPVRLIDVEDLGNNRFVVSDEVSYGSPGSKARFDIVLFVTGLPLVVTEEPSLSDGQVYLKFGDTETQVNLDRATAEITAAVRGFFEIPEQERKHG